MDALEGVVIEQPARRGILSENRFWLAVIGTKLGSNSFIHPTTNALPRLPTTDRLGSSLIVPLDGARKHSN